MAEESFEDPAVAQALNRDFVSVKVDKEERPDIDGVYMRVCQAMTGNGGWPTSIFMTGAGQPFYAGTYFPQQHFLLLLESIVQAWKENRQALLAQSQRLITALGRERELAPQAEERLLSEGLAHFWQTFDREWGGFGNAPKFPSPHNLFFLLRTAPELAEKTLLQMSRGGIFDQVGGGFCRYATDRRWLAPHFEKMLYDNALLAMAYGLAYEQTHRERYGQVLRQVLAYLEQEMADDSGGFYAAQDADADGVEGKYYLFSKTELLELLGDEQGTLFCQAYGITEQGNFEGLNIPNLLPDRDPDPAALTLLPQVYAYRRRRMRLHTDTKILTGWNALAGAAFALAGRVLGEKAYLERARALLALIQQRLGKDGSLYSGESLGQPLGPGFLDDYAYTIFALLQMYQATLDQVYVAQAQTLAKRTIADFEDQAGAGFFFSGQDHEDLLFKPKESYDSALPSGNSVMADNLFRLAFLTGDEALAAAGKRQRDYMSGQAGAYPAAFGFYLYSLLPRREITCSLADPGDLCRVRLKDNWLLRLGTVEEYPLVNGKTTYYICEAGACRPPVNSLEEA